MAKTTMSVIKADVGGYVGHSCVHPDMMDLAREQAAGAVKKGLLIDAHVGRCGDDIGFFMTHTHGVDSEEVHHFAWDAFVVLTELAKKLGQYGAGQDLLADAFSGNVRGMGPGVAEFEYEERKSEPLIIFMADKTEPGAWNMALYKMFADPFNTIGLVIDPNMHDGFKFEVHDLFEHKSVVFNSPEDIYDMLIFIGAPARYVIKEVRRKDDNTVAAATSTQRLALIAGRYVGKDDPVMIVRSQSGLPAVGEVLEPFAFPYIVAGWMRGSHNGPFMPVGFDDANPTRFDGPPRVVAYGYQMKDNKFVGPRDMFADVSYDLARQQANEIANYLRRHGPFEPQRLPLDEMEYTTMPSVMDKLADRWVAETGPE